MGVFVFLVLLLGFVVGRGLLFFGDDFHLTKSEWSGSIYLLNDNFIQVD